MAEARIEHLIHANPDVFWKVFFDPEFNRELYLKVLGFDSWNQLSLDERPDRIERVVDVVPKVPDLPGPLKKLVEGGISYRERSNFDRASNRMTLGVQPSKLEDKLTIRGVLYTQPAGDGKCRRIYESTVVAKVFGVGGMIESKILGEVKTSYEKAAEFTNRWIKEKGL